MMYRYRLLQPIERASIILTPAEHPIVMLRPDQADRLAAVGIVAPGVVDPIPSTPEMPRRGRKQEH